MGGKTVQEIAGPDFSLHMSILPACAWLYYAERIGWELVFYNRNKTHVQIVHELLEPANGK